MRILVRQATVTIDEELTQLEETFRRLKIEYDTFFGGGSRKPPVDTELRMQALIHRYGENSQFSRSQRFRFNSVAQRYAVFSDLWRRKLKIKEEGYRRPEDVLLGVVGFGASDRQGFGHAAAPLPVVPQAESYVVLSDDVLELVALFEAVVHAREQAGKPLGSFDSFANFVQKKSHDLREKFHCRAVEYTVLVDGNEVRLKVRPRRDV